MSDALTEEFGSVKLVDTDWLEKNLDMDDLLIVDCQPNVHDYIAEHIPGAVYFNPALLRVSESGRPAVYIPKEAMELLLRRVGIRDDSKVLVYTGTGPFKGWGDGLEQTFVAYTLVRFGVDEVMVLDGGIDKWKDEKKPLTKEYADVRTSRFDSRVREELFVGYEEFRQIKEEEGVVLLDARPNNVYAGQGPWMKPGHIPGAINLPWKSLMDGDNPRLLKPREEVIEKLESLGVTKDKAVICSCGTGREATNEFLLLKYYLDYPTVRLYEGSFTEWVSHPDNPTVTGQSPR